MIQLYHNIKKKQFQEIGKARTTVSISRNRMPLYQAQRISQDRTTLPPY